jgi:hypothetical protein
MTRNMRSQPDQDIEITSRSTISGLVNGAAVEGRILATFNTALGGSSSCEFSQFPAGFNPGTLFVCWS